MELLFVEKITNNIKEDKEDSWLCSSLEFKKTDTKPIYINNNLLRQREAILVIRKY